MSVGAQDLGEEFEFEEDREALQSILENRGLARTIQVTSADQFEMLKRQSHEIGEIF